MKWIQFTSTKIPEPHELVEIQTKGGDLSSGPARRYRWTTRGIPSDIIAYRYIERMPEPKPESEIEETWFLIRQGSVIQTYRSYERALDEAKKRARGDHGIKWTIAKLKAEAIVDALEPPVQVTKYTMRGVTKEFE